MGSGSAVVADCSSPEVEIPVSVSTPVAAGGTFVVEVYERDMGSIDSGVSPCVSATRMFKIGANSSGQSRPSYYEQEPSGCAGGTSDPTEWNTNDVVITVKGTTSP